jgi:hypothetical protein
VPLGDTSATRARDVAGQRVVGDIRSAQSSSASAQASARVVTVEATESAQGVKVFAPHSATFRAQAQTADGDDKNSGDGGGNGAGAKQIKTTGVMRAGCRFPLAAMAHKFKGGMQPIIAFRHNVLKQIK